MYIFLLAVEQSYHSLAKLQLNVEYHQTSNLSRTLVDNKNKIVDHSDVVGATPIGIKNS